MKKTRIIVIRLILSGVFALAISRLFFQDLSVSKVLGLGVVLFGFAYLFEYVRKRNKEGGA
ncbi:MAG: hypothetical protein KJ573_09165 [Proteobacteria bacterium]|nr:hypothetical protein [Pseudomonadota bacterium]MBU1903744.1 hypothetical protein [Pseudomonadota bacterium]